MDLEGLETRVEGRRYKSTTYWKDGVMVGRKCTKCNEGKEVSEFYFDKKRGIYNPKCKECEKEYRIANKERIKEYHRRYREANKEKLNEYIKRYDQINKEHKKEYHKQYYQNNKEHLKEYDKQRYKINKNNNIVEITEMFQQLNPIFETLNIKIYGCIYKITNIKTGHIYIGQTIKSLKRRYSSSDVIRGWIKDRKHYGNQKYLEELTEEDFALEIIDYGICKYHLNKLEVYYIGYYNSCDEGYNNINGKYKDDDGIEEFNNILAENNLEFVDNKLIKIA
jgi:hypothetical protein